MIEAAVRGVARVILCARATAPVRNYRRTGFQGMASAILPTSSSPPPERYGQLSRSFSPATAPMTAESKAERYAALVAERKRCRLCVGLRNPADAELASFDSGEIGPWSRLHGDLDARLMIIGQDWGDVGYYSSNRGLDDFRNPTMRTLERLLRGLGERSRWMPTTLDSAARSSRMPYPASRRGPASEGQARVVRQLRGPLPP